MQITTKKPKTDEEISAEIEQLRALKPKVQQYSAFGDDNHATIDAQIAVLAESLTADQVRARYPEDGGDKLFLALIAADWMHGDLVGADDTPPSQDWPCAEWEQLQATEGATL
jgi:hypothetical protein